MVRPTPGRERKKRVSVADPTPILTRLPFEDWGRVDYMASNQDQQKLVQNIYQEKLPGRVIFCSHNPLVTTGRATRPGDIVGWHGEVLETPRGGRATYHGPNQLVAYPLVNLTYDHFINFKKRDVTNYLRLLEKIVVETLKPFGIEAYQRCEKVEVEGEKLEATGVWVGGQKIASIGIAVRRWVTYHGVAINIFKDPEAFQGIRPCGFSSQTMTSMEEVLGQKVDLKAVKKAFESCFHQVIF